MPSEDTSRKEVTRLSAQQGRTREEGGEADVVGADALPLHVQVEVVRLIRAAP